MSTTTTTNATDLRAGDTIISRSGRERTIEEVRPSMTGQHSIRLVFTDGDTNWISPLGRVEVLDKPARTDLSGGTTRELVTPVEYLANVTPAAITVGGYISGRFVEVADLTGETHLPLYRVATVQAVADDSGQWVGYVVTVEGSANPIVVRPSDPVITLADGWERRVRTTAELRAGDIVYRPAAGEWHAIDHLQRSTGNTQHIVFEEGGEWVATPRTACHFVADSGFEVDPLRPYLPAPGAYVTELRDGDAVALYVRNGVEARLLTATSAPSRIAGVVELAEVLNANPGALAALVANGGGTAVEYTEALA